MKKSTLLAFFEQVDTSGQCWVWTGSRDRDGYGYFSVDGQPYRAHRFSQHTFNGPTTEEKPLVCHTCHNPWCVFPGHLYAGDNGNNMRDAVLRGTWGGPGQRRGEHHPCSKLSQEEVTNIRAAYSKGGVTQRELGKKYGVGHKAISKIVRGERWRYGDT